MICQFAKDGLSCMRRWGGTFIARRSLGIICREIAILEVLLE
jgi:hypothetical protein